MALLTDREHEERPWGSFERFTLNELSTVKILTLKPAARLSLQEHAKRSEFWRIIAGEGVATIGEQEIAATVGSEFEILPGVKHRLAAGEQGISCLEIALGEFDEHDEVRVEDDYQRSSPPAA